ncbi:hypothetical protein ACF1CY_003312 [Providencia rettgeri]
MTGIVVREEHVERIQRFNSLQSGQYWRAMQDIPEEAILMDEVLLIESLRWVENQLHTVILRAHPKHYDQYATFVTVDKDGGSHSVKRTVKEHRFLFNDFVELFEFADDARQIRDAEVALCQQRVTDLTQSLSKSLANPEAMKAIVAERIEQKAAEKGVSVSTMPAISNNAIRLATGSVGNAIAAGVTEVDIKNMRDAAEQNHQIATIQSEWIQERNTEITAAVQAVVPYFAEMAAAQLAATEDARSQVDKLMNGIQSLDLYIGKDVNVKVIRKGQSAPSDEPLTFVQQKLMVDEEMAIYHDLSDWFDFGDLDKFYHALCCTPALVDQIFPSPRCVLVMATTRRYIDYKDRWDNIVNNAENAKVFLMVRDGENLYRIVSPVESHLGANMLFPSQDEQERLFRGMDGEQIKFQDVAYSDRLKAHERMALHYKRFLILCCGLDHREQLFGDFYDRSLGLNFVSMKFQEQHCRFIHDADGTGMLSNPENKQYPSLAGFIEWANSHLRSGSRVMCQWHSLANPETAPGAAKENDDRSYGSFSFTVDFKDDRNVAVAFIKDGLLNVKAPVSKTSYSNKRGSVTRDYNVNVCIEKYNKQWKEDDSRLPYLCLDAVTAEHLEHYIYSRAVRSDHNYYIALFKSLAKYLREERQSEQKSRDLLKAALVVGRVGNEADHDTVIDKTVMAWRAANRGAPLAEAMADKAQWENLLGVMDMIACRGMNMLPQIVDFARIIKAAPLRLIVNTNGKLSLYVAPTDGERDDRLEPHIWVQRINFNLTKTGIKEGSRSWVKLNASNVAETTIFEWPEAEAWKNLNAAFGSYEEKQEAFSFVESRAGDLHRLNPANQRRLAEMSHLWKEAYYEMNYVHETGGQVQVPALMIPIGIRIEGSEWNFVYVGSISRSVHCIYQLLESESAKNGLAEMYASFYKHPEGRIKELSTKAADMWMFSSKEMPDVNMFSTNKDLQYSGLDYSLNSNSVSEIHSFDVRWRYAQEYVSHPHRSKSTLWLAESLLDECGRPIIDTLLGSPHLHQDDPVDVIEVTLPQRYDDPNKAKIAKTKAPFNHAHWFDICPVGYNENQCLEGIIAPVKTFTRMTFANKELALHYIFARNSEVRKYQTGYFSEVEVPLPEGVTRWTTRN